MSRAKRSFWRLGRERLIIAASLMVTVAVGIVFAAVRGVMVHNERVAHTVEGLSVEMIRSANVNQADKLMIVAHPDDETLWGGGHLMEGRYLVVCITNGRNDTRKEEFAKTMEASGNSFIMLEYPDKVNGVRDSWEEVSDGLRRDIDMLVAYKNWKLIVTHNPNGEYGHQHHKMTSQIVTEVCRDHRMTDRLMYMGKYYSKTKIGGAEASLERLSDDQITFKKYLLGFYNSQKNTNEKFTQMTPYEMWQSYDSYYGDAENETKA